MKAKSLMGIKHNTVRRQNTKSKTYNEPDKDENIYKQLP